MPEKWDADRELNDEIVEKALLEQFPNLDLRSIEYLGSGWDFDAYLVNKDTVIRFPRRQEVAGLLGREEKILTTLNPLVGNQLNLPEIVIRGESGLYFPYPFFGHRFIKGVSSDHASVSISTELAEDIGSALTCLHTIEANSKLEEFFGYEKEGCEPRFEETRALVETNGRIKALAPDAFDWLRNHAVLPPEFSGSPRLIHNDFCPDHIIVDPESGRLAGIIDWSDIAFGDPVLDFILLVLWGGHGFSAKVLSAYQPDVDAGFGKRLEFLSRALSLKWLVEAIRQEGDVEKHVGWVKNAFT